MPAPVEVFADICCPFTYVGLRRLLETRDARGLAVRIRVRAWPLEWVNGEPLDPHHVASEVEALRASVAPDLFGGFDPSAFPRTSIPAFGLAAAAYARDYETGERASLRLRTAVFEEGADVGDPAVLDTVAGELGIEPLSLEETEAAVRADHAEGRGLGVVGSPHYFAGPGEGWFCPALQISRADDGRFVVEPEQGRLAEFLDRVLGAA